MSAWGKESWGKDPHENLSLEERVQWLENELRRLSNNLILLRDEVRGKPIGTVVSNNTKKTEAEMVNEMLSELPTEYWEDETDLSYENVCYLYNEFYGGY